jgi:LmbE family N-acetylglucosaminyl deacetylase
MDRRFCIALAFVTLLGWPGAAQLRVAPPGERPDAIALELALRKLSSTGTFMQTDAHPDDEDNGLLAMLGLGQGMRATLVTLTRGDGGQNEIGPELGQSLGVLRTEELLAVHRFDGAEQYFTRAIDFGFSFSVEESIEKWGRDEIVGDLVRHIRTIRPDVIAGFLCGGQAGGLHHQASAVLTREAFRAAADPNRYPEQIREGLRPWQATRYFCTDETSFAPQPPPRTPDMVVVDLSGFDPLLGRTYAELGLEARSMHKCQGTSQLLLLPGAPQNRTYRLQEDAQSAPAVDALFQGIDVSVRGLARFAGASPLPALTTALQAIQQSVIDATAAARGRGPAAALTPLVAGLRATRALRTGLSRMVGDEKAIYEIDTRLAQKERQFQDALALAAGLRLDALADDGVVTAGQSVSVTLLAAAANSGAQFRGATLGGFDGALGACNGELTAAVTCRGAMKIPVATPPSTPYWTPRHDAARYNFEPGVPFGLPFRPTPFRATFDFLVGGEPIAIDRPVEFRYSNLVAGEKRSQLNVVPDFNVSVDPEIAVILPPKGGSYTASSTQELPPSSQGSPVASPFTRKVLRVTVANNLKTSVSANVSLQLPTGWTSDPATQPVRFTREDESATVTFALVPPGMLTPGEFSARAVVRTETGSHSDSGYQVVEYPHIHRRHVVREASARVKIMELTVAPGVRVGYVMGVGDAVPDAIEQLGVPVTLIGADMLAGGDLGQFSVIVLGVRAYERRPDLRANNQRLLQYVENGGTVVVQYQRAEFNAAQYGPYPAKTTAERITDENAAIEEAVPDHPVFTTPNRIGAEAWKGWVQERGTYFMGERDPRYIDLLRAQDPFPYNAGTKTGILVEARVGKGRWLYTGLGLWRQLPAGTDGAYRLLANLISLGKQ